MVFTLPFYHSHLTSHTSIPCLQERAGFCATLARLNSVFFAVGTASGTQTVEDEVQDRQ
jgi:hypothetical protein